MRILVAEDERPLSRAIVRILEKSNFSADAVYDGAEALNYLQSGIYDAAILDVMMPKADGISVLRAARAAGNHTPVLFLTARSEVDDRVAGLDAGADYYLTKPFDAKELIAALRVITRSREAEGTRLTLGNLTLDRATFELSTPKGRFRLANKEFQMMELFLTNPRCVISAERFMERIWGCESEAEIGVVAVYVSYLRKKLAAIEAGVQIRMLRGAGYALEENS